jgi:hypothetical protein
METNLSLCCILSPWAICKGCSGTWCVHCWGYDRGGSTHHPYTSVRGGWVRDCNGVKVFEDKNLKGPPYVLTLYETKI